MFLCLHIKQTFRLGSYFCNFFEYSCRYVLNPFHCFETKFRLACGAFFEKFLPKFFAAHILELTAILNSRTDVQKNLSLRSCKPGCIKFSSAVLEIGLL